MQSRAAWRQTNTNMLNEFMQGKQEMGFKNT